MSYATTEHNRQTRLKNRIRDAYGTVRHLRYDDSFLQSRLKEVWNSDDWKRASGPTKRYLQGYSHALREEIWRMVHFCYVTERGPVFTSSVGDWPGCLRLTDDECRNVDIRKYKRGFAWPPEDKKPFAWFTKPEFNE